MIKEILLGGAVLGGGGYYVVSNQFGADIVREVNASPGDTWRAFDSVLNLRREELGDFGMSTPKDPRISWPIVTSVPGKEIDYVVKRDGQEAIHLKLNFASIGDGRKTKLSMNITLNQAAFPEGSPGLANAAMFRIGIGKVADEFIKQIENGKITQLANAFTDMRRQMQANPNYGQMKLNKQEYDRREAQNAASRPQLDPNAARLNPVGVNPNPSN